MAGSEVRLDWQPGGGGGKGALSLTEIFVANTSFGLTTFALFL